MTKTSDIIQPRMVTSHDIHLDEEYAKYAQIQMITKN